MITENTYTKEVMGIASKADVLFRMQKAGLPVPSLVAFTVDEVAQVSEQKYVPSDVLQAIEETIVGSDYIVRSAVISEDGLGSAQAGVYESIGPVTGDQLAVTILQVIGETRNSGVDVTQVSIIVQRYVRGDRGGVLFTTHPHGTYCRVIEYQAGGAEGVVHGGEVVRKLLPFSMQYTESESWLRTVVQFGEKIEALLDGPQDIEWVAVEDEVYIVQARPITTLSQGQRSGLRFLRASSDIVEGRTLMQAPAAETFTNPTPLAFSLLEYLHRPGGPVQKAYEEFGIVYTPQCEHVQIGTAVYVDTQRELQSLYPAYTYTAGKNKVNTYDPSRLWQSWKNAWRIRRVVSDTRIKNVQSALQNILSENAVRYHCLSEVLQKVDDQYTSVFQASLLAQQAIQDLTQHVGVKGRPYVSACVRPSGTLQLGKYDTSDVVGNSINVDDTNPYSFQPHIASAETDSVWNEWLSSQPTWRQHALRPYILRVHETQELREAARLVAARLATRLRDMCQDMCLSHQVPNTHCHQITLEEFLSGNIPLSSLQHRYDSYVEQCAYVLPKILSNEPVEESTDTVGLVPGVASGEVVTVQDQELSGKAGIVLTETLSTQLIPHLSHIAGIITRSGGLLSHTAIMAREVGVPVVCTQEVVVQAGDYVTIDGSTGTVEIRESS